MAEVSSYRTAVTVKPQVPLEILTTWDTGRMALEKVCHTVEASNETRKKYVQVTTTRHRDGPLAGVRWPIGGVVMPVPDASTRTDDYWQECIRIRPQLVRIAARRCAAPVDPDDIVGEALVRGAEF